MNIKLTANVSGHGYELNQTIIDENGELNPIAYGLLTRGFQKILTDAHSTATRGTGDDKRKADEVERVEDVKKRLAKLVDGTYSFGGGGGKLSTPEDKAMKHTLQKYGVKFSKGDSIATGLKALAQATAVHHSKEYEDTMDQTIAEQLRASDIYITKLAAEMATKTAVATTTGLSL